jgi:hypothetical protein
MEGEDETRLDIDAKGRRLPVHILAQTRADYG